MNCCVDKIHHPATVVPAVTATTPAAAPTADVAPYFGLVFSIDLLLLFLPLLPRWPRHSTGLPVQAGRASLEQVLGADRLEVTRVPQNGVPSNHRATLSSSRRSPKEMEQTPVRLTGSGQKLRQVDRKAVARQRTFRCVPHKVSVS